MSQHFDFTNSLPSSCTHYQVNVKAYSTLRYCVTLELFSLTNKILVEKTQYRATQHQEQEDIVVHFK